MSTARLLTQDQLLNLIRINCEHCRTHCGSSQQRREHLYTIQAMKAKGGVVVEQVRPDLPELFALNSPYHNRLKLYLANDYRILDLVLTFQYDTLEKQVAHNNLCQNVNACGHPRCVNKWCFALVSNGRQRELRRYLVLYKDIHEATSKATATSAGSTAVRAQRGASGPRPTPSSMRGGMRLSDSGGARSVDSTPSVLAVADAAGQRALRHRRHLRRRQHDALTGAAVSLPPLSEMRRHAAALSAADEEELASGVDAMDTEADDMDLGSDDYDADQVNDDQYDNDDDDEDDDEDDELDDDCLSEEEQEQEDSDQFKLEAAVDEQLLRENPELDPFAVTAASPTSVLFSNSPPLLSNSGLSTRATLSGCQFGGELDFFAVPRPVTHATFDWNQTGNSALGKPYYRAQSSSSSSVASSSSSSLFKGSAGGCRPGSLCNSMEMLSHSNEGLSDSRNWALTSYPQLGLSSSINTDDAMYGGCGFGVRRRKNRGLSYSGDSDDDLLTHRDYLL
eukprot:CAMPEP_0177645794 /NCGR_PEP_ID=MMETSP0447-20121125/9438_1 /TAXON_ID=0 /ORGANISM="Stygamoeba regulata, Strain BSH-02190019" /LENGTH=507 /DNA_ID=CAMNT_0019148299 /DNA_START=119 /DNA_END=1642 /DNA_ORIENTATION=+